MGLNKTGEFIAATCPSDQSWLYFFPCGTEARPGRRLAISIIATGFLIYFGTNKFGVR